MNDQGALELRLGTGESESDDACVIIDRHVLHHFESIYTYILVVDRLTLIALLGKTLFVFL